MARRVRESARDIEIEIRAQAEKESQLDEGNADLADQIKSFIQTKVPVFTGGAVGSILIKELKRTRTHPLPGRLVYTDDPMFHMIEYGTKADPSNTKEPRRVLIGGQWVTLDRNTPTQAVAPFGQARARFGKQIK